jgi:hypothetical protein
MAQIPSAVQAYPTCCVPAHLLAPGRAPFLAPARNPAKVRDLAERGPGCAATVVAPGVVAYTVAAKPEQAPDHSTPCTWVALWKDLSAAHLPLTVVAADNPGQRELPAGVKAEKHADRQAAFDFFSGARRAGHDLAIQDPFPVCTLIHAALR